MDRTEYVAQYVLAEYVLRGVPESRAPDSDSDTVTGSPAKPGPHTHVTTSEVHWESFPNVLVSEQSDTT